MKDKEYGKWCGLRGNVGYVGAWVNFFKLINILRGSYVSCVGQIYFCERQNFFCVGHFLLTRGDCFTILQPIV